MAETEPASKFFTEPLYDRLKFIAQIILPALGTLVFAVGGIWGWDATTKVVGSITALDLFLGVILGVASNQYYSNGQNFDGTMHVTETADKVTHALTLNGDPDDLANKKVVTFNVNTDGKHEAPST